MTDQICSGCGLPDQWCCCHLIPSENSNIEIALLLHENEPARPTSTSKIIQKALANAKAYIWQRTTPPEKLVKRINAPDTDTWLLFPADRPELQKRKQDFIPSGSGRKTLIVVPDGTWKEVRKMVRKSPWLDPLPILAFDPKVPSRYDLRRNPDHDHLCTAETVAALLTQCGETSLANNMNKALDLFIRQYKASKRNEG